MVIRQILSVAFMGLAFAATAANAADDVGGRVASGIGHWIAEQGNAALEELRDDLKRNLDQTLKPLLPPDESRSGQRDGDATAAPAA